MNSRAALAGLGLTVTLCLSIKAQSPPPLFDYLAKSESKYSWRQINEVDSDAGQIFEFAFTSQTWRGIDWSHQLRVYVPKEVKYPKHVLLFITGGSTDSKVKPEHHAEAFILARACGARVAVLPQVPNQPLMGGKREDDLIGETFVNFINTQEADWPLLFPMVKSAVKAMDAVESWAKERNEPVEGFVVTGASKRGWTTWLSAAVDPRVKGIAPMVIPTLNMKAQTLHQKASWGFYSEQIEDYTRRGLTEKFDDPVGGKPWKMVDPYSYLDRIKVPILQINGTNDRYWTLDSMNLYWNDIKAPKYVVYLPNAGHGLEIQREWAVNAVGALFRHVASGKEMPRFSVSHEFENKNDERPKLTIANPEPTPKRVSLWAARAETLDFRQAKWERLSDDNWGDLSSKSLMSDPPKGENWLALLAEMTFEIDGMEYHLSTPIWIVGKEERP